MSPVEIAVALRLQTVNRWSGILLLDAKYLNKRQLLLLAVDFVTLDIVAWLVVAAEIVEHYTALVDAVEACGYIIRALVSDGHPAIIALTHTPKPSFTRKGTRSYQTGYSSCTTTIAPIGCSASMVCRPCPAGY